MSIPLPPIEELRQMRFSTDFWLEFTRILQEMTEHDMLDLRNLENMDEATADLFFTTLAARLIEVAGPDEMPTLDDTITLIKVILDQHMKDFEILMAVQQLNELMGGDDK